MQRYGTLSSSQKRAVSHFLKYMAQNDQYADSTFARKALDEYWGQFDSSSEDVTKRK
jgi:hypothetical protein